MDEAQPREDRAIASLSFAAKQKEDDGDDIADLFHGLSLGGRGTGANDDASSVVALQCGENNPKSLSSKAIVLSAPASSCSPSWKLHVKWPGAGQSPRLPKASPASSDACTGLRPYQVHVVKVIESIWSQGKFKSVLLQLPTGAGKTVVAGACIRGALEAEKRACFVVAKSVLVEQSSALFSKVLPQDTMGFIKAGMPMASSSKPFCVCSIQTLTSRKVKTRFDLIIIDEAHHATSPTYAKFLAQHAGSLVLGLTATPFRLDPDDSLTAVFDSLVEGPDYSYLVRHGYLVPPVLLGPHQDARVISSSDLRDSARLMDILKRWRFWTNRTGAKRTVAFASDVAHAHLIGSLAGGLGIKAKVLTGDTPDEERADILEALEKRIIDIAVSCMVLGEGWDCPCVECLLLLRPTASKSLFLQQIGRGLRPYPGKHFCLVIDESASLHKHGAFAWGTLDRRGPLGKCPLRTDCLGKAWVHPSCKGCHLCSDTAVTNQVKLLHGKLSDALRAHDQESALKCLEDLIKIRATVRVKEACKSELATIRDVYSDENASPKVRTAAQRVKWAW